MKLSASKNKKNNESFQWESVVNDGDQSGESKASRQNALDKSPFAAIFNKKNAERESIYVKTIQIFDGALNRVKELLIEQINHKHHYGENSSNLLSNQSE